MSNLKDCMIRLGCECCIKCKGKVLVQIRNPKAEFYPNYLCFPGGHLEFGEDPITTIIREIREETGISLVENKLKLITNSYNFHKDKKLLWNILTFEINFEDFPETVSSSEGEVKWIELNELINNPMLVPPMRYYTEHTINNKKGICFLSLELENDKVTKVLSEKYL